MRTDELLPAPYCTDAFIAMEAAACWTRLAAPRRALDVLQRPKASWPDQSRRDKGLHLARTAAVYVGLGDDQKGIAAGRQALSIARQTGSARTIAELRQLRRALRSTSYGAAVEFTRQIASLSAAL